ncbi:MAG: hypothetical protein NWE89_03805 [Candidatus Bathyarchaeota archaeon]|nr:hypothetical protein [Candidatus Bathyarchaeota archaeon]
MISYILPQYMLTSSIRRSKRAEIEKLNILYQKNYEKLTNQKMTNKQLLNLLSIMTVIKEIENMPEWIIDFREMIQLGLSMIVPLLTITLNIDWQNMVQKLYQLL